ncbi:TetR/AcrR family transcriptional regulator [Pyruvatibacter mobilis]|jgi:AcrR family transcriptional regulator|uniref:TetR/AcrR family transcriptional regulator n=1 Tax=Pyruvatibacter mobilis TaxID=1712261 RepID=UPI003BABC31C
MTGQTRKGRKSASYHHGDLKRELLAAARALLEEVGPEALSLRSVARAAGVSQAAPYHHFEDKDALLAALATEGFAELSQHMDAQSRDAGTSGAHMGGLGAGYILFAVRNPALFRLMHGPRFVAKEKYTELLETAAHSYEMLRAGVTACLGDAPTAQEIDTACTAAWSLVHGASMLVVDGRVQVGDSDEEIIAFAARMTGQLPLRGV